MENTLSSSAAPLKERIPVSTLVVRAVLVLLLCLTYGYFSSQQPSRFKLEMSSGKNGKHVGQGAKETAEAEYQKAKEAFDTLNKKPKKSRADNDLLEKLKKQVQHWRKKKDWSGENHSQKHKGLT